MTEYKAKCLIMLLLRDSVVIAIIRFAGSNGLFDLVGLLNLAGVIT